jgi:cyanophycin synthetase
VDVTDMLHPENIFFMKGVIGLDICGVDIMAENLTQPKENGGVILEVNAAPGFRMHLPLLKVYQEMSQLCY